jgi:hypothetical protein
MCVLLVFNKVRIKFAVLDFSPLGGGASDLTVGAIVVTAGEEKGQPAHASLFVRSQRFVMQTVG